MVNIRNREWLSCQGAVKGLLSMKECRNQQKNTMAGVDVIHSMMGLLRPDDILSMSGSVF